MSELAQKLTAGDIAGVEAEIAALPDSEKIVTLWQVVANAILEKKPEMVEHFAPHVDSKYLNWPIFARRFDRGKISVSAHTTLLHLTVMMDDLRSAKALVASGANPLIPSEDPRKSHDARMKEWFASNGKSAAYNRIFSKISSLKLAEEMQRNELAAFLRQSAPQND
jgi:hypothetical protein